jgi:kynureninase
VIIISLLTWHQGHYLDVERIVEEAHKHNILVIVDVAHSIGSCPIHLDKWDVDGAVFCSYKYINGGIGGLGGFYLNTRFIGLEPVIKGKNGYVAGKKIELNDENTKLHRMHQISVYDNMQQRRLSDSMDLILEAGLENFQTKILNLRKYLQQLLLSIDGI